LNSGFNIEENAENEKKLKLANRFAKIFELTHDF